MGRCDSVTPFRLDYDYVVWLRVHYYPISSKRKWDLVGLCVYYYYYPISSQRKWDLVWFASVHTIIIPFPIGEWDFEILWFHVHYYYYPISSRRGYGILMLYGFVYTIIIPFPLGIL